MTPQASARLGTAALGLHVLALLAGLGYGWAQIADVSARRAAVDQTRASVARLTDRISRLGAVPGGASMRPTADLYLAGDTVTVAGANLQDRVVAAIRQVGGAVTSSQVDLTGATATPATIVLAVSCTLPEPALQRLLYDLEAGTPFLYVDQLSVQSSLRDTGEGSAAGSGSDRLTVSLSISAFWQGGQS